MLVSRRGEERVSAACPRSERAEHWCAERWQGAARGIGAGKRKDAEHEGRESERGQGRVVKGAWEGAGFSDEMYVAEGASIVSAADVWKDDVVVAINDPGAETAGKRWKTARS